MQAVRKARLYGRSADTAAQSKNIRLAKINGYVEDVTSLFQLQWGDS
jgi:hypothetical protein